MFDTLLLRPYDTVVWQRGTTGTWGICCKHHQGLLLGTWGSKFPWNFG